MNPAHRPLAFVVGAQRSGTSWVQRLLGAHPQIVAGQESHLFSSYLAPIWHRWWEERVFRAGGNRSIGLACYLTQDELIDEMRQFALRALTKMTQVKPGAKIILEKTPDHALHLPLIEMLFPQAALIHVLRDGRDVVASLRNAHHQGWGRGWAPSKVADAARRWMTWVQEIRHQSNFFKRCHVVRFEDLLIDGSRAVQAMFEFLDVPLPPDQVRSIYDQLSFTACASGKAPESLVLAGELQHQTVKEPDGFFRQGKAGGWQQDLTAEEQEIVHSIAGKLLAELGYLREMPRALAA